MCHRDDNREERSCRLIIKTYDKTKLDLIRLTELMSQSLGTRLTRSQAVELLIRDGLNRYAKNEEIALRNYEVNKQ